MATNLVVRNVDEDVALAAAIALIHGLDVVTRNVDGISATGVNVLNPFI